MKLDLGVREFERDTLALGQWFAEGHPLFRIAGVHFAAALGDT
jgi:hypothetical protein